MKLYEEVVKPQFERIAAMSRAGLSQAKIAENLGIGQSTFEKFIKDNTELKTLIREAKYKAVEEVENAMFQRAIGIRTTIRRGIKVRKVLYDERGRKKADVETIEPFDEELYIPPDTEAGKFLLKNWAKDRHYSNEPETLEMRKKEIELKEKALDGGDPGIQRAVILNDIPK